MRIHMTHRISPTQQLVLEEADYGLRDGIEHGFGVSYMTLEPSMGEDAGDAWYSNNSEVFSDYNVALDVFRRRRDSENPFHPLSRFSHVTGRHEL